MPDFETSSFESAKSIALQFDDQHIRAFSVGTIDDVDFQKLAMDGLVSEQQTSFDELQVRSRDLPYEALGQESIRVNNELKNAQEDLALVRDAMTDEMRHYDDLVQRVVAIVPLSKTKAEELAEHKKEQVSLRMADEARERIAALTLEQAAISDIYEAAGMAWTRPLLVTPSAEMPIGQDGIDAIIDDIPVEPTLSPSQRDTIQRFGERVKDAPELSKYIALYLAENAGRVVTVDELAEFAYSKEVIDTVSEYHIRARITTNLGPQVAGKRIEEMLLDQNMLLQYGWRSVQQHGKTVNRTRIYRAYSDEHTTLPSRIVTPINSFDESTQSDIFEHADVNVASPESSETDLSSVVVDITDKTLSLGEALAEAVAVANEIRAEEVSDSQADREVHRDNPAEIVMRGIQKLSRHERTPDWEKSFAIEVGETIAKLEEANLMTEELINSRTAGRMSNSAIFATRTAIERMVEAKLLPKSALDGHSTMLSTRDLVIMDLQNTHRTIFTTRARSKRALEIVDQSVKKYFENQKQAAASAEAALQQ